jgi:hypothetical protein
MPVWVKVVIEAWAGPVGVVYGRAFRPVNRGDRLQGEVLSEKVVWQLLRPYAAAAGVPGMRLMIVAGPQRNYVAPPVGSLNRSSCSWAMPPCRRPSGTWARSRT